MYRVICLTLLIGLPMEWRPAPGATAILSHNFIYIALHGGDINFHGDIRLRCYPWSKSFLLIISLNCLCCNNSLYVNFNNTSYIFQNVNDDN